MNFDAFCRFLGRIKKQTMPCMEAIKSSPNQTTGVGLLGLHVSMTVKTAFEVIASSRLNRVNLSEQLCPDT
jgi:hypothetical protein